MSLALLSKKSETVAAPTSLRIGRPDDAFEHEADDVAEEVLSGGKPQWSLSRMGVAGPLRRKCDCGGSGECEECLRRKSAGDVETSEAPAIVHQVLKSAGEPLDRTTRAFMEQRFNYDFSHVRIHVDDTAADSARATNALAYTVGQHIAFASGRYRPETHEGRRLVAHELAHTIQQGQTSHPVLARQNGGQARDVQLPQVEETEEDKLKQVGNSETYRSKSTNWGWGAPETNNVYEICNIAPLERAKFKAFFNSLPREQRIGRKKPPGADEVLGVTTFNPGDAKPPEIAAVPFKDGSKTTYKLKPVHAEMPPMRSAYTQAGSYVEGFQQNIDEEICNLERRRLGTSKFPITWTITPEGAQKIMEAEQEHCNDIRAAFDLTLGLYASAINNLAASERTYSRADDPIKDATRAAGVAPDAMIYKFQEMAVKTRFRDDRDWHTAQPIGDPRNKNKPREENCKYYYTINASSWPEVGTHKSDEVMGMANAGKPPKPTKP